MRLVQWQTRAIRGGVGIIAGGRWPRPKEQPITHSMPAPFKAQDLTAPGERARHAHRVGNRFRPGGDKANLLATGRGLDNLFPQLNDRLIQGKKGGAF